MGYALRIYEAFKDDETKAKLLSEFIEQVEQVILNNQLSTRQDVTMSELKLTKEIEATRGEIKEVELKLTKEIEQVRADLKNEIHKSHASLLRWVVGLFVTAVLAQAGLIIALLQYSSGR